MNQFAIAQVPIGSLADWISAVATLSAAVVALFALYYAKRAYETQSTQMDFQQSEINSQAIQLEMQQRQFRDDIITRRRLRLSQGPLLDVSSFPHYIDGLEVGDDTGFPADQILNSGAFDETKHRHVNFEKPLTGYSCVSIHNNKAKVKLANTKVKCLTENLELFIFEVQKVRRLHINFDWKPIDMWVLAFRSHPPKSPIETIRFRLDFETEANFFDRYIMEINLLDLSIKQLYPISLFDEKDPPLDNLDLFHTNH